MKGRAALGMGEHDAVALRPAARATTVSSADRREVKGGSISSQGPPPSVRRGELLGAEVGGARHRDLRAGADVQREARVGEALVQLATSRAIVAASLW